MLSRRQFCGAVATTAALGAALQPIQADDKDPKAPKPDSVPEKFQVKFETSKGDVVIEVTRGPLVESRHEGIAEAFVGSIVRGVGRSGGAQRFVHGAEGELSEEAHARAEAEGAVRVVARSRRGTHAFARGGVTVEPWPPLLRRSPRTAPRPRVRLPRSQPPRAPSGSVRRGASSSRGRASSSSASPSASGSRRSTRDRKSTRLNSSHRT